MLIKYKDNGWRKRFCIIPMVLEDGEDMEFVWLRWYWRRFMGTHYVVSLTKPNE